MMSDEQMLTDLLPVNHRDARIVRVIDGAPKLERILNRLPPSWVLLHLVLADNGRLVVVFSRDPDATKPGDFDHVDGLAKVP